MSKQHEPRIAMAETQPSIKLSVGGVEFNFLPHENDVGSIEYHREGMDFILNLTLFTGTLRVSSSSTTTPDKANKKESLTTTDYEEKQGIARITPRAWNPTKKAKHATDDDFRNSKRQRSEAYSPDLERAPSEPIITSSLERSININTDGGVCTLGQPDMPPTQTGSSEVNATSQIEPFDTAVLRSPGVKMLMDGPSQCSPGSQSMKSYQSSRSPSRSQDTFVVEEPAVSPVVAAQESVGSTSSPAMKRHNNPPCPRWGHTMTDIGLNRVLIYGGQSFDETFKLPVTMSDLHVFDVDKQIWFKPFNCEGLPRQWHTSTYLPERQLMISFGGESITKTGKAKTNNQVMVLDTEIMLWYPPSVSGDVPSGRSGHTATLIPETDELVVFGGVSGSKWLNTVSVLDTFRWVWRTPKVQGSAPKPRSYHSATACSGGRILIFGGNDATQSFNSIHVLETADEKWQWTNVRATGDEPSPRTGHIAVVLDDGKTLCVYGGWDPNADEETYATNDDDSIFQEVYLLDTELWIWRKGPRAEYWSNLPPIVHGKSGGPKRVGHTATFNHEMSSMILFGGRVPGDAFTGDFQIIPFH